MAEAQAEAERILAAARDDAAQSLDQARSMADQLVEDAKEAARNEGEGERAGPVRGAGARFATQRVGVRCRHARGLHDRAARTDPRVGDDARRARRARAGRARRDAPPVAVAGLAARRTGGQR
ncbi:MAG: hypothetical protein WKF58_12560 [Ilumatobacteraceae bacterium]